MKSTSEDKPTKGKISNSAVSPGLFDSIPVEPVSGRLGKNGDLNKLSVQDRPIHSWYRFVLSYPPHLVRDYLERFELSRGSIVLDPFCGTGTTVVECKKLGYAGIGIEANPLAHFACETKTDWDIDPDLLLEHSSRIAQEIRQDPEYYAPTDSLCDLTSECKALLLADSISPLPLHKSLLLLKRIEENRKERFYNHQRLALATALVYSISNLHFGPEVGLGQIQQDSPVVEHWINRIAEMASHLRTVQKQKSLPAKLYNADARQIASLLEDESIDAVITSPPYPNEKDYTRTTRLESVILGFLRNKSELRALKQSMVRSNTRGVYRNDDDQWISQHPRIGQLADEIEQRRIQLGKTSGFERMYHRVTRLYFGGMARHLFELRTKLKPGAKLAYVVGDQASYLRVLIRTGELLAQIAVSFGYEIVGIDLFRTRLATATRQQLREEVVLLRWSGNGGRKNLHTPFRGSKHT